MQKKGDSNVLRAPGADTTELLSSWSCQRDLFGSPSHALHKAVSPIPARASEVGWVASAKQANAFSCPIVEEDQIYSFVLTLGHRKKSISWQQQSCSLKCPLPWPPWSPEAEQIPFWAGTITDLPHPCPDPGSASPSFPSHLLCPALLGRHRAADRGKGERRQCCPPLAFCFALPPLPVLGKRPASVAALPTGCRGRRGARAGVQAAAGSCLLRGLWSLLGLCALSRSEQMGPRKEPLWHCCWASVAFSAIVYFISPQSRSSLRKTWCLFGPSLSKRELWGLSILQGHQWNFCSLSSVRVCSGSR